MRRLVVMVVLGCGPRMPPPTPDQSVRDAMVLVCDAPTRAAADPDYRGHEADVIAKHLTDGVGNSDVLLTVDGWKTDGIKRDELDRLIKRAGITDCRLREVTK